MIRVHSWLKNCGRIGLSLLGFCLLAALPLRAQDTIEGLIEADRLRITTRLDPADGTIATQRTKLIIEIATDRWFAGGTKLGTLEIRNSIVLQTQSFAVNSTRREGGKTWAVQQWSFDIFPRFPGTFQVPPVALDLAVSSDSGGIINGRTFSQSQELTATLPPIESPIENWVVSPRLTLTETWDKPLADLQTGDARQRTIVIDTDELPSMVLSAPATPEVANLGIYPQPAQRQDSNNRGASRSTLTQTTAFFFERPGTFTIPGVELAWWNPATQSWTIASIEPSTFEVAVNPNAPAVTEEAAEESGAPGSFLKRFGIITVLLFLLAVGLRWIVRKVRALRSFLSRRRQQRGPSELELWHAVHQHLSARQEDPGALVQALYAWSNCLQPAPSPATLSQVAARSSNPRLAELCEELLDCAYGPSPRQFGAAAELGKLLMPLRPRRWWTLKRHAKGTARAVDFDANHLNHRAS